MDNQNLWYALAQVAHNFGAVAVVAVPLHVLFGKVHGRSKAAIAITLAAWLVQFGSGAMFGLISLYYYGMLPDIHGTAVAALAIKVSSAALSVALCVVMLRQVSRQQQASHLQWSSLATTGLLALTAAAVLRWFS
jgi:hypothetical protein